MSHSNNVDSNAATLPTNVTLVMKVASDVKWFEDPYLNSLLIMIVLNYAAVFFNKSVSWINNSMLTRLVMDVIAVFGTIVIGDEIFPLNGPQEPKRANELYLGTGPGTECHQ